MITHTKTIMVMMACCAISACALLPMSTDSGAAAEIGSHPIYTVAGSFYVSFMEIIGLQEVPNLYFDDPNPYERPAWACIPPTLAAYQAAPETWEPKNRDSFKCRHMTLIPLPVGTAVQVDGVMKSWDFENGTRYQITAHLVDPSLPQRDFEINGYLLVPGRGSPDETLHLDPRYFTAQPPKVAQHQGVQQGFLL